MRGITEYALRNTLSIPSPTPPRQKMPFPRKEKWLYFYLFKTKVQT